MAWIKKRTRNGKTTYRVGYRPHPRTKEIVVGEFQRKRDAQKEKVRIEAAMAKREGIDPRGDKIRLGEWLDEWMATVVKAQAQTGRLSPTTVVGYESHVRVHLKPKLGSVPLRKLTVARVEKFLSDLQAYGSSAGTAMRIRATLSKALSDAMRDEIVHRNVAQIARPPKVDKRQPSAFTPAEFERMVAAAENDRLGTLFVLAALTGMRASELRGLRWTDVNLDEGWYEIHKGLHRISRQAAGIVAETGLVEANPKTEGSGRRVPLSEAAVAMLREHRKRQARERLASRAAWPETDRVFTTSVGTRLEPSNVRRSWRALLHRADVPYKAADGHGRGLHELRRTFATRLRDAGIPLEDVQRLGRWASPQVLLASYAATPEARLRAAADAAAAELRPTSDPNRV